jgi:predicted metal-dependent hydrolase
LIAVNPRLDRPDTPPRLLEYLIYHEMLHALQPEDHRQPHDRAFREALHRHPDHEWAMAWEKANHDIIGIA